MPKIQKKDRKILNIKEAIDFIKANSKGNFDATIEVHANLGINHKKQEQTVRTTTVLPHGTGKTVKVAVFSDKTVKEAELNLTEHDIERLEKGEIKPKIDFDVLISEPKFMAKLAKAAKILGPAGVMPSPKAGTVTDDVEKAVSQVKGGKIEIRNEINAPIMHTIIGKRSFDTSKLVENFEEVMSTIRNHRPQKVKPEAYIVSVFISSTMGPSVQIQL